MGITKTKLKTLTNQQIKRFLENGKWRTAPTVIRQHILGARDTIDEVNRIDDVNKMLKELIVERYLGGDLVTEELFRSKGRYEAYSRIREEFPRTSSHKAFKVIDDNLTKELELIEKLENKG